MNKENFLKQASYWLTLVKRDKETMSGLFKLKRYPDALFYGHLVLEKMLKSLFVIYNEKSAPLIHDLGYLSRSFKNDFSEKDLYFLEKVNKFNIKTRYPDERFSFYKLCDKKYTLDNLEKINIIYNKICLDEKLKKLL